MFVFVSVCVRAHQFITLGLPCRLSLPCPAPSFSRFNILLCWLSRPSIWTSLHPILWMQLKNLWHNATLLHSRFSTNLIQSIRTLYVYEWMVLHGIVVLYCCRCLRVSMRKVHSWYCYCCYTHTHTPKNVMYIAYLFQVCHCAKLFPCSVHIWWKSIGYKT